MKFNKLNNIINLNSKDRYEYAIREIVKLEKIWAVSANGNWLTFLDNENDEIFPIWAHEEVAQQCILEELRTEGYFIKAINLKSFIEFCIPDMHNNKILFGVFYDEKREALVVTPNQLKVDLHHEKESD